jgi:natural product biosynthesis luciferase-like monooxygenase protein
MVKFSLFYFADDSARSGEGGRYRLLMDGARFADTHGFEAVWIPERHFHSFGGLYPNPSVIGAAIAAVTRTVAIRAGSVVAPLHHPLRIAEEWSAVDNLSGGRVAVSLASGWNDNDFVLRPEAYPDRLRITAETVDLLRRLWRGESMTLPNGSGLPVQVRVFPPPVQPELPIWITSGGTPRTFEVAGELGAGVLTHLVRHDLDELAEKIATYRTARRNAGWRQPGQVTLMLHTLLGDDTERVRDLVRDPMQNYLASSLGLASASSAGGGRDPEQVRESHRRFVVKRAFDRYFESRGLFGTVEDGMRMVRRARAAGVDEIACLVDFGIRHDDALSGLEYLDRLRQASLADPGAGKLAAAAGGSEGSQPVGRR